jgi:hypothetical protein
MQSLNSVFENKEIGAKTKLWNQIGAYVCALYLGTPVERRYLSDVGGTALLSRHGKEHPEPSL